MAVVESCCSMMAAEVQVCARLAFVPHPAGGTLLIWPFSLGGGFSIFPYYYSIFRRRRFSETIIGRGILTGPTQLGTGQGLLGWISSRARLIKWDGLLGRLTQLLESARILGLETLIDRKSH